MNIFSTMNERSRLISASEVIDALGGPTAMTQIFGGGPSRFCNYRAKGGFPDNMHMRIYAECLKRGLTIAPELIGMTDELMALARGERQWSLPLAPQASSAR
jgi:hypothetical protein